MTEPASFEELRRKRLRYVESARENDFEQGLKSLLSELYPDNAHFIYELLQNAEDALATTVEFTLNDESLRFTHDGKRAFSLADIESITGIGNSTKKDDPTQIGKFGVGFKAVFSYTTRPEVRSGRHSFAIEDLFVPAEITGAPRPGVTTFTFPFDREEKPAAVARDEVARGLSELDEKTLLFLNHIATITYELPDGTVGIITREALDGQMIRVRKSEGDDFVASHWLRLTGPATVEQTGVRPLMVAAAFRLETDDAPTAKRSKAAQKRLSESARYSIVPVDDGDVSIHFPAVKESSGLRFHIHAPFASTVARDSVRDDPANVQLVEDIARLIVDSLPALCADGLIDDSFLATVPNQDDHVGHPYDLISSAIEEAFNELAIAPVRGGAGFAAARELASSPSEFRNWLEPADLPTLFVLAEIETEQPPRWIRERDGRAGKFLAGLDTKEFGWEELSTALSNARDVGDPDDDFVPLWLEFLDSKSDDRIVDLYQLIGRGRAQFRLYRADLEALPIVRLRRRGKQEHVKGPATYLPSSRSDTVQARVPVDMSYFDDDDDARSANLRAFYSAAGVKRWNESAKIEQRIASYEGRDLNVATSDDFGQHLEDVRAFVRYGLANRASAQSTFGGVPFLQAVQSDGSSRWVKPSQTFLDLPFRETGLSSMHPRVPLVWKGSRTYAYDQDPYPLAGVYLDVAQIEEFVELVGGQAGVEIVRASVTSNPQLSLSWRNVNRENTHGERVDWSVDGLERLIEARDETLLRSLWHTVVAAPSSKASAFYQANGSSPRYRIESQLAQTLKASPWIPDRNGELRLPRELTPDDLLPDWKRPAPTSLVMKLDFGADALGRKQKREGVESFLRDEGLEEEGLDLLREAKEAGVTIEDLREFTRERAALAEFPGGASEDPVRRASTAALDAASAPKYTTSMRERSVVDGSTQASAESRAYLREQYSDDSGAMFCQACRKPLPFRTKDGLWYFEAVRLVNARSHVHMANAIALCPLCAALYTYARATPNDAILESLANTTIDSGQPSIQLPIVLNNQRIDIAFTGRHAIDVKVALGIAGDART